MSRLKMRWVGEDERDRVAETRMLCYAAGRKELPDFIERLRNDPRSGPGDWLLAEDSTGRAVGTATSHAMTMRLRGGGAISCQGVAWVGTIRTHRRRSSDGSPGVATAIMNETLRTARERGMVVSALMPFRGSFYEKFGYGFIERRSEWTIPMSVLPKGDFGTDLRYYEPGDFQSLVDFKQRLTERTHGDIERPAGLWKQYLDAGTGHAVLERVGNGDKGGPARSFCYFEQSFKDHLDTLRIEEVFYEDTAGLLRQLKFLASLRDQYAQVVLTLPADVPLHWLLAETQLTHRERRNHPTAACRPITRMQVRILDPAAYFSALRLSPTTPAGKCTVAIHEAEGGEGGVTRLAIESTEGRFTATPATGAADVEFPGRIWPAVAFGDLSATRAAELGLATVTNRTPLATLDAIATSGPAPYCREYF